MAFVLFMFAIVGVVWATWLTLRGSLMLGCCAYLVLACCFGPYFFSIDAGITLTLDRIFLVGLIGVYVAQWRLGKTETKPLTKVDWTLFAFIGILGISTFTHDWRNTAPGHPPILQHLINGYLIPLTIYWIARNLKHTEQTTNYLLGALSIFGIYLGVIGCLEMAEAWSLVFPRYIADPELGLHFGRARGPMVQSVSYGVYVAACMLAVWLGRSQLPKRFQFIAVGMMVLFAAAIYFTKTRSVWLGAASGMLVILSLTVSKKWRGVLIGGTIAAGLLVGIAKYDSIMGLQREGTVADTRQSASMRGSFAYVSWKMFLDRPIWGVGFGHFTEEKYPYLSDRNVDMQLEQIRGYVHHSTFLAILTETGLIGFLAFLALVGQWVATGWRMVKSERAPPFMKRQGLLLLGIIAVAFWQWIGHETSFTPLDNSLIFLIAGSAVGMWAPAANPQPSHAAPAPAEAMQPMHAV